MNWINLLKKDTSGILWT